MSTLDLNMMLNRLPHRPPFRFISSLGTIDAGVRGEATWEVRGDEAFFRGHFPDWPIVPGVLLVEALAQLSGLVALGTRETDETNDGRLAHVDVRFDHPVIPPATISLRSETVRQLGPLHLFSVQALVDGQTVARGTIALAKVPPP